MYNAQKIAQLLADKIIGKELMEDEEQLINSWMEASPKNRQIWEKIKRGDASLQILELEEKNYGDKMAAGFMKKKRAESIRRRLYSWIGSSVAAVVLLAIVFTFTRPGNEPRPDENLLSENEIVPGKVHAVLTLNDGRSMDITGSGTDSTEKDNSQEVYHALNTVKAKEQIVVVDQQPEYFTLSVPAGGEFFFSLPDSSKVWLNSKTELRFPLAFSGSERRVYLKGEAFFEVSENNKKPFVISLADGDVTVYGTRFNITDYDEAPMSAVLVEGSIGFVAASGKSVKLKPSQRMIYETATDHILVEAVDTAPYTAWVHKMFMFNGQRLDEIMTTLSRWYDVHIAFDSEAIKAIRLSGKLYRYEDIRLLLKTYEEAGGIQFTIEGKHITISKK